ncbi:hypothetical protein [Gorillibacterium sp. sgz5001074]|uniref:hypothetical protein n=1 Tax=Gorillibacterium sp. sgz5001074 TaxID=3446695 RepID=UPI003F68179A
MNIYGHIKKANNELSVIFNADNLKNVKNELILQAIVSSWLFLKKFIKNIRPDWTQYFSNRLENIIAEELIITNDMLSDSFRQYERMINEREVKSYIYQYIKLMETLLTFNKPFEESCAICQGELFYFTDLVNSIVFKECNTCGAHFDPLTDIRLVHKGTQVRPSTRFELLNERIIEL